MELSLPDDRTPSSLAATLLALAILAERTASRPFPVCWLVLTILRQTGARGASFPDPGDVKRLALL
jgi:hypothetical protein